jgi:hypothetical protein
MHDNEKKGCPMGEIKSTLDLVMEKTKHLSLSEEEKLNTKKIDMQNKIRGLINKYEESTLNFTELKKSIDSLQKQYGSDCSRHVAAEVLK